MEIKTGVQEYNLAGKVTVRFNPTDMQFADRMRVTLDNCIAREEAYQNEIKDSDDIVAMFSKAHEADEDIAKYLNALFGVDVVSPLCEDVSVRAWADGMPIWANVLMAVMEVMDASQEEAVKASQKRIEKYTKKYSK